MKGERPGVKGRIRDLEGSSSVSSIAWVCLCWVCVRGCLPPPPPRGHTLVCQPEKGFDQGQCHAHHSPSLSAQWASRNVELLRGQVERRKQQWDLIVYFGSIFFLFDGLWIRRVSQFRESGSEGKKKLICEKKWYLTDLACIVTVSKRILSFPMRTTFQKRDEPDYWSFVVGTWKDDFVLIVMSLC